MAEELQHLIERIQKDAVETGERQAEQIISQARQKAAGIIKEAEEKAAAILEKAKKDSEAYTERSIKTIEQAARDLLITVGQGVENILADLVDEAVAEALNVEVLEKMMVKMAEAYTAQQGAVGRVELLISPEDQKELVNFFVDRYRQKLGQGVELHVDNEIIKGFKVAFKEAHLYHDFTQEAIGEALKSFLRPHLSEIVHRVAKDAQDKGGNGQA